VLLASQAKDPGQESSYQGIGFVWRPYVEFLVTSFALGAGSFVCPSIHEVLRPSLSYATPLKQPWSWGIAFWAFCTGLLCGALRRLLHIGEGEGYFGWIGNTAPSSSDIIPMGSKRFVLQGIEYAFL
jgi:hypothetical protein